MAETEKMVFDGKLDINYKYASGKVTGKFYDEIEENKKIFGIKCSKCNTVYVPPRQTCGPCFTTMEEWVEVQPTGVVTNYTIVNYAEPLIQPMEPPYAQALIKLEGADTPFIHLIGEVDVEKVKIGMKVEAVFAEEKTGNILNIKYFKPVE
ncbi:MAG: Zn-ribbon domain-containing OB-fold protein [Desulfobacterales bacterium]|jgi:uncharacterized protein|nr:Zn-ribbon domain-containing OB-fold protein [Desulfobacteraceae bacterium]MBT7086492.1 Zn-ribbon domain-containing OB-fold protein [Desulfobacterales bacterium]MBT7697567.1 Zn-ribbon domain-containing OB-fold protein [Desulfobacterales bacterium]